MCALDPLPGRAAAAQGVQGLPSHARTFSSHFLLPSVPAERSSAVLRTGTGPGDRACAWSLPGRFPCVGRWFFLSRAFAEGRRVWVKSGAMAPVLEPYW